MQEAIEDVLIDENGTEPHPGGILMEAHDIRAMADAIVRLMATPGLAAELGANAQARALSHFHIDGAMSRYGALFRGGLGAPDLAPRVAEPSNPVRVPTRRRSSFCAAQGIS